LKTLLPEKACPDNEPPTYAMIIGPCQFNIGFHTTLNFDSLEFAVQPRLVSQNCLFDRSISCLNTTAKKGVVDENEGQIQRSDLVLISEKIGRLEDFRKDGFVWDELRTMNVVGGVHVHLSVSMTRAAVLLRLFSGRDPITALIEPCFASRRSRTLAASK
jgi:hypothetical protein